MILPAIRYRSQQFWSAIRAQSLNEAELRRVSSILSPAQLDLFSRLQPSEQVHALRVLNAVQEEPETSPDLWVAALLHDVGKSRVPLKTWERVLIVLVRKFLPGKAAAWGRGLPNGWRRAFVVAEQHPVWGAELAAQVGCSALTIDLIGLHQQPSPGQIPAEAAHLLALLRAADEKC